MSLFVWYRGSPKRYRTVRKCQKFVSGTLKRYQILEFLRRASSPQKVGSHPPPPVPKYTTLVTLRATKQGSSELEVLQNQTSSICMVLWIKQIRGRPNSLKSRNTIEKSSFWEKNVHVLCFITKKTQLAWFLDIFNPLLVISGLWKEEMLAKDVLHFVHYKYK